MRIILIIILTFSIISCVDRENNYLHKTELFNNFLKQENENLFGHILNIYAENPKRSEHYFRLSEKTRIIRKDYEVTFGSSNDIAFEKYQNYLKKLVDISKEEILAMNTSMLKEIQNIETLGNKINGLEMKNNLLLIEHYIYKNAIYKTGLDICRMESPLKIEYINDSSFTINVEMIEFEERPKIYLETLQEDGTWSTINHEIVYDNTVTVGEIFLDKNYKSPIKGYVGFYNGKNFYELPFILNDEK
jgi:hypothetical protein